MCLVKTNRDVVPTRKKIVIMSAQPTVGRSFRVSGGSKSDNNVEASSQLLGLFQRGVDFTYPKEDRELKGRILPARNADLQPEDKAWLGSVAPYRDITSGDLDPDTSSPAFTAWYTNVQAYRFFGKTQESFLSPATLRDLMGAGASIEDTADPIEDCGRFAKRSGNAGWEQLIIKPNTRNGQAVIPWAKKQTVFNMYLPDKKGIWRVTAVITSRQALLDLKTQLAWPTPRSLEPVDPQWENYLFGDITNPVNGLAVRLKKKQLGQISCNAFVISDEEFGLRGVERKPVKDAKILEARYDLQSNATLKIFTYQELVNFLVEDGAIPHQLIVEACEGRADIPNARKQNTHTSSPAPRQEAPKDDEDFIPGAFTPTPKATSAHNIPEASDAMPEAPDDDMPEAPEDEMPEAPEEEPEKEYFTSIKKVVARHTESQIRELTKVHGNINVMNLDKSLGWQKASVLGLMEDSSPTKGELLQALTTKPGVEAPKPAAQPTAPEEPSANGNASPDEKARYELLLARATNNNPSLSPEEMQELVELSNKVQG